MFIAAGSRKCSRKSRKRERQRRLQKLNLRKRNPPRRKQRNKMKKFLAAFLGALIAFVWSAIAHQNPLTMTLGLSVLGPKEDAVLAALKRELRCSKHYLAGDSTIA